MLALLNAVRDPVGTLLSSLTTVLLHFTESARNDISVFFNQYLFSTKDIAHGGSAVTASPPLHSLNLGLAFSIDALTTAVIIFASLRTMFERSLHSHYSLKIILPRLLTTIVLCNFSLPLMQLFIDLNNALGQVVLNLGGNTLTTLNLPWSAPLSPGAMATVSLSQDLFHAVFAVALVIGVVILALTYIVRYALLQVLIVMAPLAAFCTALPDTRRYAHTWMRLFLATVFIQAVHLVILRVAIVTAFDTSGGFADTLYALATIYILLKAPGVLNEASRLETKAKTIGHDFEKALRKAVTHGHAHTAKRSSS